MPAKWGMCLGALFTTLWVIAHLKSRAVLLIPASILAGAGQALMWVGEMTYATRLARRYAHRVKTMATVEIGKLSTIFLAVFQLIHVPGDHTLIMITVKTASKSILPLQM